MKFSVIEKKKTRLQVELEGAGHTVCNALVQELWNDKSVTAAAYNIDHPLVGKPKIVIESSKDPKTVLQEACKRLIKQNDTFAKAFAKA